MSKFVELIKSAIRLELPCSYFVYYADKYYSVTEIKDNKYLMSSFMNSKDGLMAIRNTLLKVDVLISGEDAIDYKSIDGYPSILNYVLLMFENKISSYDSIYTKLRLNIANKKITSIANVSNIIYANYNNMVMGTDLRLKKGMQSQAYFILRYIGDKLIHVYSLSSGSLVVKYVGYDMYTDEIAIIEYVTQNLGISEYSYTNNNIRITKAYEDVYVDSSTIASFISESRLSILYRGYNERKSTFLFTGLYPSSKIRIYISGNNAHASGMLCKYDCYLASTIIDNIIDSVGKSIRCTTPIEKSGLRLLKDFEPSLFAGNFGRNVHNRPMPVDEKDYESMRSQGYSILRYPKDNGKLYAAPLGCFMGLKSNMMRSAGSYEYMPTCYYRDQFVPGTTTYNYYFGINILGYSKLEIDYSKSLSIGRALTEGCSRDVINPLANLLDIGSISIAMGRNRDTFIRCICFALDLPIANVDIHTSILSKASENAMRCKMFNPANSIKEISSHIANGRDVFYIAPAFEPILNAHIFSFEIYKDKYQEICRPIQFIQDSPIIIHKEFNRCIILIKFMHIDNYYYDIVYSNGSPFITGDAFERVYSYVAEYVSSEVYSVYDISHVGTVDESKEVLCSRNGYALMVKEDDGTLNTCLWPIRDTLHEMDCGSLIDKHVSAMSIYATDSSVDPTFTYTYSKLPATSLGTSKKLITTHRLVDSQLVFEGDDADKLCSSFIEKKLNISKIGSVYTLQLHKIY